MAARWLAPTILVAVLVACSTDTGGSSFRHDPYPFTKAVAPTATPVDGTYARVIPRELLGGDAPCVRCPPYRLTLGPEIIGFDRGTYRAYHWGTGYVAVGNYTLDNGTLTLFNDAWCPVSRGVYEVEAADGFLALRTIEDTCAFDSVRARYLEALQWRTLHTPEGVYFSPNDDRLLILDGELIVESAAGKITMSAGYTASKTTITVTAGACAEPFRWTTHDGVLRLGPRGGSCSVDLPAVAWYPAT
jgi:hypothetical protein